MPGPLTAVWLFKYMEVFRYEGNDEDGEEYIIIIIIIFNIVINIFIISTVLVIILQKAYTTMSIL